MQIEAALPHPNWSLLPAAQLGGATVEWVGDDGKIIISSRHRLYTSLDQGLTLQLIASLPEPLWKRLATQVRPLQRLLRAMCYNVIDIRNGPLFVTYGKSMYSIRSGAVQPIAGLHRPTRVLRGACALGADGAVYFGEYFSNPNYGEVFVYHWDPSGDRAEVVYAFPAQSIRHIHGIYSNPADDSLWCLTGDREHECRIIRTVDSFRTIDVVGEGDETWRAVSIQFDGKFAYYGMDAGHVRNKIFRLDIMTGQRDELGEVNGPVYYSAALGNGFVFGVAAELCPSQTDGCATLWYVDAEGSLSKIASWQKDILPHSLFMSGAIHLSRTPKANQELWIHGVGLQGADNLCFRVVKNE
jgi:hypothetical protein